jgi:hypothetical protein
MKSWNEMLKKHKERSATPVDLEKVFKIDLGNCSLNVTKIGSMEEYIEMEGTLNKVLRSAIEEFNESADNRCVEILHKWGEKFDIEELKTFSYSMSDEQIDRLIDKYKIKIVTNDECSSMCSEILPCQPELVCVVKKGNIFVIDEEED